MKRILFIISILTAVSGFSQQAPLSLSLKDAVEMGLKNRYDIQSKKYNVELSQSEVSKSKKEWIPEISGSGMVRYNHEIQPVYIPGGGFGNSEPALVALGATNQSIFGLDLNQTLFKPGIGTDVKISKNNTLINEEKIRQEEDIIKEQITLAYFNVTLRDLQYRIALSEENRFKEYAELAEGRFKAGTLVETDLMKAKLDYENAKVESQKSKQNYELAIVKVKYQINIPENTQITLVDSLNSEGFAKLGLNAQALADIEKRTEIRQLKLEQEGLKLSLTKVKQSAIPSVSLFGNYSTQFTYDNFNYGLGQWWSKYNYVGVQFKVPITSNFKNYDNIQEQKIKTIQNELNLKQKTADVNYEILKSTTEVANAQQNVQVTKNNYELSQQIYINQKAQYSLGARSYGDLLETERSLRQAEQSYLQAVYDYLVASVNYKKAIGAF